MFSVLPLPCLFLELKEGNFFIKDVNKHFLRDSKMKKEELLGLQIEQAFPQDPGGAAYNWNQVQHSLETCLRTGDGELLEEHRYDVRNKITGDFEEHYWRIENIPVPDEEGQLGRYALNISQNVTEIVLQEKLRHQLEKELQDRRKLHEHFIQKNQDGLFSLDSKGNILSVNEVGLQLGGVPEKELLGRNFLEFTAPCHRERLLEHLHAVVSGEIRTFNTDYGTGDSKKYFEITLMPMEVKGEFEVCYGIAHDITEHWLAKDKIRQQKEALERSERKHKTLVEKASDLICISDENACFTFASESYKRILGYVPLTLIGRNAMELVHPEDRARVHQDFSLLETKPQVQISPYRFQNSAGDWRWVESIVTNLMEEPLIRGLLINTRDVTETVERTSELQQLNERYRLAATATKDTIYEWNLLTDQINIKIDPENGLFGHSSEVVQRRNFWRSHLHPDEKEAVSEKLEKAIYDKTINQVAEEYRFQRADGTYAYWMDRAHIIRDKQGRATRVLGAKSDISELVQKQEELRMANKRFSLAMKATDEMIWDWDLKTNTINRSELFLKNFGYGKDDLFKVRENWLARIAEEDRDQVTNKLFAILEDPTVIHWREEYCFLKQDGSRTYLKDRGYIVRDKDGRAVRMVGATLDVTESRRLLYKVSEQNRILREVAWEQSHLVRAPLARLKGLLNFMQMETQDSWTKAEILQKIHEAADELDGVIRKIVKKSEELGPAQ